LLLGGWPGAEERRGFEVPGDSGDAEQSAGGGYQRSSSQYIRHSLHRQLKSPVETYRATYSIGQSTIVRVDPS
jgi:hypothetical protein